MPAADTFALEAHLLERLLLGDLVDLCAAAVQELKAAASSDLTIGGAILAARAFAAGLVDECQLFVWPMIVGGGKPALPASFRTRVELLDEHRFNNGVVRLLYRIPS